MTQSTLKFYGADWCPDCRRSKRFLERHAIAYEFFDTDQDRAAAETARALNKGRLVIPTIVFADGTFVTEPSDAELAARLAVGI